MFSGKTAFVIGAGASKEAGLPSGGELKATIASLLTASATRNPEIYELLRRGPIVADGDNVENNAAKYLTAAQKIVGALPGALSIDNYINQMSGNPYIERCGKLAIIKTILDAEQRSRLFISLDNIDNELDLNRLKDDSVPDRPRDTWFLKLSQLLFEDCPHAKLQERLSSVSFIIFNYDRCVEHFLYWALRKSYDVTPDQAAELVNNMQIYHPYGTVGSLPWQLKGEAAVNFGQQDDYDAWVLASGIKTFTEGTDPTQSEILGLRAAMDQANNVIFLGFGFIKKNLELITPPKGCAPNDGQKRYFGTATGASETDLEIVRRYLEDMCSIRVDSGDIQLRRDCYCTNLFDGYGRSFSLEPISTSRDG